MDEGTIWIMFGACGEDYEGKSNNQGEDGAHCGEHYFCDVCDSDMG